MIRETRPNKVRQDWDEPSSDEPSSDDDIPPQPESDWEPIEYDVEHYPLKKAKEGTTILDYQEDNINLLRSTILQDSTSKTDLLQFAEVLAVIIKNNTFVPHQTKHYKDVVVSLAKRLVIDANALGSIQSKKLVDDIPEYLLLPNYYEHGNKNKPSTQIPKNVTIPGVIPFLRLLFEPEKDK